MAQEGSCFETASNFHLILGCSKQSAEPTKQHQTKAFRIPPILHSTFHSDAAEEPQVSDPLQRC
jgi:predicted HicB family RNase H-like nuclease